MMNRSFKSIIELHAVSMAAIDGRAHNDANRTGRMRNSVIDSHHVFLGDDLSPRGIDERSWSKIVQGFSSSGLVFDQLAVIIGRWMQSKL